MFSSYFYVKEDYLSESVTMYEVWKAWPVNHLIFLEKGEGLI